MQTAKILDFFPLNPTHGNVDEMMHLEAKKCCNRQLSWEMIRAKVAAPQTWGFSVSSTSNYLEDQTCEDRRQKIPLLGSLWFACASLLSRYSLPSTLQTTLFTLLLRQCIWGSFARDLFQHLSRALCCKITSYLEKWLKKGPRKKLYGKRTSSLATLLSQMEAVPTAANMLLSSDLINLIKNYTTIP